MSKTITPKPQVTEQIENLDGQLATLHSTVNALLEHLHAAGMFAEEVGLDHYESDLTSTSAMAGKIEQCANFVGNINAVLAQAHAALAV